MKYTTLPSIEEDMMKLKILLVIAALCVWVALTTQVAQAIESPLSSYYKFPTALLAESNTAVSRSFSITGISSDTAGGYGLAMVYLKHKTHTSLTKVTMACVSRFAAPATPRYLESYELNGCDSVIAGACKSVEASWYKDITGVKNWGPWRINVKGTERVDCTLTFTGGSADDTIEVNGAMQTLQ